MATPIGHGLAGYAVFLAAVPRGHPETKPMLTWCVCLAISPDLDFLPGVFIGQPALFHQCISHSLLFAVGAGLLAALLYQVFIPTRRSCLLNWGVFSFAYASHLVLDFIGPDKRAPYGIPLFWPFLETSFLSPLQVLLGVHHASSTSASTGDWIQGVLDAHNLKAIAIEVIVILPFLLFGVLWHLRSTRFLQGKRDCPIQ